jgi:predicted regulator of Ras-like GTPase activity (Roadblock/LC7/MglB family)
MSGQRESKAPTGQKPAFIPFSSSGGSQPAPSPAKPFVQQSPAPQSRPAPGSQATPRAARSAPETASNDEQPPAQARPKNLSSISSLAARSGDASPAPATKSGRVAPAISIPSHDNIGDEFARPASPAPVLSGEGRKPSGNLSNPLNLRNQAQRAAPVPQSPASTGGKDSLEKTMKRELESFNDKMDLLPKPPVVPKKEEPAAVKEGLPFKEPENLGDVLRELIKVDPTVKASALVKRDGTILASAISSTLSDSLIAIIATTVTTVGSDIMFATEAGDLKYITFAGTNGIVHIVPTIGDIFLIILTGPNSKQGIISVVAKQVEKGVKTYLNL